MESKISEKLAELDTLLAKSKEDRTKVEAALSDVEELSSEVVGFTDDPTFTVENGDEKETPLTSVNQQPPGTSNQSSSKKSNVFEGFLQGFNSINTSSSKKLQETLDQLNAFIGELEEKRERIEKAKTLEELEGISLGTPVSIDSKLLADVDAMKTTWDTQCK